MVTSLMCLTVHILTLGVAEFCGKKSNEVWAFRHASLTGGTKSRTLGFRDGVGPANADISFWSKCPYLPFSAVSVLPASSPIRNPTMSDRDASIQAAAEAPIASGAPESTNEDPKKGKGGTRQTCAPSRTRRVHSCSDTRCSCTTSFCTNAICDGTLRAVFLVPVFSFD